MNVFRTVEQGRLEGALTVDGEIAAFKGVPYAAPPVADLRWRPPQPPAPWRGVRPAVAFAADAPQPPIAPSSLYAGGHEFQSEDCLYLNIWCPAGANADALPVLVWLHFGAFQFGGASAPLYDGEGLARAGAVVVTLNYRLGRLGFLAHPELTRESGGVGSGNYGLLDQIAALHWVQRDIGAFGGDLARVTLMGLSAGSSSVSLLMTSPLAEGLFARAIAMSGGQLGPVGESTGLGDSLQDLEHAERSGVRVAEALGATTLVHLRSRTAAELMAVELPGIGGPTWHIDAGMPISRGVFDSAYPIVDGNVVTDDPYRLHAGGRVHDVPLLTGSCADEKSGLPYLASARDFVEDARAEHGDHANEFLALYPAGSDAEARESSARANGDRIFVWQNWTLARLHAGRHPGRTFYYHTSRVPPLPPGHDLAERAPGAFHSLEIPYVFRHLDVRPWPWEEADRRLSELMSAYWVEFARRGDPNSADRPLWLPFDPAHPAVMEFGDEARLAPVPRLEHLAFWDAFYTRARNSDRMRMTERPSQSPSEVST